MTQEPQDPSPFPSLNWEKELRQLTEEDRMYQELQARTQKEREELQGKMRRHRKAVRPLWMLDSFVGGCLFLMICLVLGRRPK